jgi:hypothetical protein
LNSNVHSRLYVAFHLRDIPEISYLTLCMHTQKWCKCGCDWPIIKGMILENNVPFSCTLAIIRGIFLRTDTSQSLNRLSLEQFILDITF